MQAGGNWPLKARDPLPIEKGHWGLGRAATAWISTSFPNPETLEVQSGLPDGYLDVGQVLGRVYLSPLDESHPDATSSECR